MPFKSANIHFTIEEKNEKTTVTVSPAYELKFGFLGRIMDTLVVRKMYLKGMKSLLKGLKKYIEEEKS